MLPFRAPWDERDEVPHPAARYQRRRQEQGADGALRELLGGLGYSNVSTYIASGNVILSSRRAPGGIKRQIESALPKRFRLDSELIAVRVMTHAELRAVVDHKPQGFGEQPGTYHSDAIFLIGIDAATAMEVFDPHPQVDRVWPGDGVIYSQRLSAQRTKSRLNKAITTPLYKSMTIRSWSTTLALLDAERANAWSPKEGAEPMSELIVDFITSLDGYASAEGWPGWWGLESPGYLAWLDERPDRDYTVLMGANTYRLMSGFASSAEITRPRSRGRRDGRSHSTAQDRVLLDAGDSAGVGQHRGDPRRCRRGGGRA